MTAAPSVGGEDPPFYQDLTINNAGYYRFTSGASAMEPLGTFKNTAMPGGTGLWVTSDDGKSAEYFTAAGTPATTLPISGALVGGDSTAAYVEVQGSDSTGTGTSRQLWRYPIDGSAPTMLANSPTVYGRQYIYDTDPLPVANKDWVVKLWAALISGSTVPWIFLQWIPLK